jgi:ketosteroid isomerase-like protein
MSEENLELARQMFDLFRNRESTADSGFGEADVAKALELFHPDFELDATRVPMPDLNGRFRGPAEVAHFWRNWLEVWGSIEFEVELTDAGDRVFAEVKQRMRGKGSGVEVPLTAWQVITLRDGQISSQAFFLDKAEALEAAGMSE